MRKRSTKMTLGVSEISMLVTRQSVCYIELDAIRLAPCGVSFKLIICASFLLKTFGLNGAGRPFCDLQLDLILLMAERSWQSFLGVSARMTVSTSYKTRAAHATWNSSTSCHLMQVAFSWYGITFSPLLYHLWQDFICISGLCCSGTWRSDTAFLTFSRLLCGHSNPIWSPKIALRLIQLGAFLALSSLWFCWCCSFTQLSVLSNYSDLTYGREVVVAVYQSGALLKFVTASSNKALYLLF